MGFFVFLIILVLIFNTQAVLKFFGALLGLALAGLAVVIFFFCASFSSVDMVGLNPQDLEATVVEMMPESLDTGIAREINGLRVRVHNESDPSMKALLTHHLERLENIQRQRDDEKEALERLRQDRQTLDQVRRTRESLESTRKQLADELERLERLEDEMERSRRYMDKYLETETPHERK